VVSAGQVDVDLPAIHHGLGSPSAPEARELDPLAVQPGPDRRGRQLDEHVAPAVAVGAQIEHRERRTAQVQDAGQRRRHAGQ